MGKDFLYNKLDKLSQKFFPETGEWYSSCFDRPIDVNERYFPAHTCDITWLALMFQKKFGLFYLTIDDIKEYMRSSCEFEKQRHDYVQRIVKWQIDYMVHDGEGWIVDPKLGGDFYILGPVCDIAFRKGIVTTLGKIGVAYEEIEEGIEKNANMWREKFMYNAFCNIFEPIISFCMSTTKEMTSPDPELKNEWLQMRRYEYYQMHKDSVSKYGEVLPEMKMSDDEAQEFLVKLREKEIKRLQEISKCEESNVEPKYYNSHEVMRELLEEINKIPEPSPDEMKPVSPISRNRRRKKRNKK